jgi:membrane protease YdiL (CAAX protease family)
MFNFSTNQEPGLLTSSGVLHLRRTSFRGYLQRQFLSLTNIAAAAIALSSVAFGAGHIYLPGLPRHRPGYVLRRDIQRARQRRKSQRPGMLAHASQDTIRGLLGSVVR